jgi:5-methylcytosine-specific restriction enzyme B
MGKIGMPKHSSDIEDAKAVLKVFYEADGWVENDDLRNKLKIILDPNQYHSSYTKKAQIPLYFGFATCEDDSRSSRKRITENGKKHYLGIVGKNKDAIFETIVDSLENMVFGRNNYGCPSSDSDIDPPSLFIRAVLELGNLSLKEFEYLLWKLADKGDSYSNVINEIENIREKNDSNFPVEASESRYSDAKPLMYLIKIGFLIEAESSNRNKKYKISNEVMNRFKKRLYNLKVYNIDKNIDFEDRSFKEKICGNRITGGENILLYGVPGSGKSYTIKTTFCSDKKYMERVVFHPDYTYSDFVGQILPRVIKDINGEEKLRYVFVPGPFTKMLKKADTDPDNMYYLVIEEVNRGNAPAIFGEIFQLLDRKNNGESEYGISNYDIALKVYGDQDMAVKIPSNLTILATMNTSDQNVFTLDTAFQRRWNMQLIENRVEEAIHANSKILDTDITWKMFNEKINKFILEKSTGMVSSEDKRLGAYFIREQDLLYDTSQYNGQPKSEINKDSKSKFPAKVLKYLWDDVFKYSREDIFKDKYLCLEDVIFDFENSQGNKRFDVFKIPFITNEDQNIMYPIDHE